MYLHLRLVTFDRRPDSLVVASGRLVLLGSWMHIRSKPVLMQISDGGSLGISTGSIGVTSPIEPRRKIYHDARV
jgi:hypothetical protein